MHSGEIVPSFHSAFVSHSPRGSSQSESAFFAMWVSLLRNSDLPYLACSGSSSISWSANLRSGVIFFFCFFASGYWSASTLSRGAGGKFSSLPRPERRYRREVWGDGAPPRHTALSGCPVSVLSCCPCS